MATVINIAKWFKTDQAKKNIDDLGKSVDNVVNKLIGVIEKTKDLNKVIKTQATTQSNTNKANKEANKLTKELTAAEKELNRIIKAGEKVTEDTIKAQVELTEKRRKYREEAKKSLGIQQKSNSLFKSFTRSILAAGAAFLTLRGGINVLKNIGRVVTDFSKSQSNLAAVLGKSKSEISELTELAKQYGAVTKFTASEVTDLEIELAKLGFTQDEIINSTGAVLDLAAATDAELGQAAKVAGSALRAFNLDATESERVASVLAVATTKSALSFSDYEAALSTVAPVAKSFGFTIEDTVALMGKLKDAGFDASTAATSTRNILLNLADTNGKLAKSLGGPVKNFDELIPALAELRDKGVNLNETLQLTDKRSVAAFNQFLTGAESAKELRDSLIDVEDELAKMTETQLDNLSGDLAILNSAWEGFILSMEDGTGVLAKVSRGFVQLATDVLESFRALALGRKEYNRLIHEESLKGQLKEDIKEFKKFDGVIVSSLENTKKLNEERLKTGTKNIEQIQLEIDHFGEARTQAIALTEEEKTALEEENKELEKRLQNLYDYQDTVSQTVEIERKGADIIIEKEEKKTKLKTWLLKKSQEYWDKQDKEFAEQTDRELEQMIDLYTKETEAREDEIVKRIKAEEDAEIEAARKIAEEKLRIHKQLQEKKKELTEEIENTIITIATDQYNAFIDDRTNSFIESQEAQEQLLKDRLDKGAISEQEYETKIQQIKLRTRQKEAEAEKRKTLFDIGINTAVAIVKALPNIPLSILVGSIGALQAATVLAKPIPQFFKGLKKGELKIDTWGEYGEKGREIIKKPGEKPFIANKSTIDYIPAGTEIIPNYETEKILNNRGGITESKLDHLLKESKKEKPIIIHHTTVTKEGFETQTIKGSDKIKWLNKYMHR